MFMGCMTTGNKDKTIREHLINQVAIVLIFFSLKFNITAQDVKKVTNALEQRAKR